jgi:hypothetical protein
MTSNFGKTNYLFDLHAAITELPKLFRKNVCAECSWSETTFYRKARGKNTFSNAEKEKIRDIAKSLVNNIIPEASSPTK